MKTNGNDSAFNTRTFTPNGSNRFEDTQSLTKREYFAGLAMVAFAQNTDIITSMCKKNPAAGEMLIENLVAMIAVRQADALIDALNKENE